MTLMQQIPAPPADQRPAPRLDTVHEVERILRKAAANRDAPLSYAEIGRRMSAKSVRHATLRAAVQELARLQLVVTGSKGVLWVLQEDPKFWSRATRPIA